VNDLPVSQTAQLRAEIEKQLHDRHDITHTTLQIECDTCGKKDLV
jgi:Co/Zn/Cd efflux system component